MLRATEVARYLGRHEGEPVELLEIRPLGEGPERALKRFGYGRPLLLRYRVAGGAERRRVLGTVSENSFGHERRADRVASQVLAFDTFNTLPGHVAAIDVGVVRDDGALDSLADTEEFFLLSEYVEGSPYALDLIRLRDGGELEAMDLRRAERLARYLTVIHARRRADPAGYRRRIRDLLGSGEGIMGLSDSYPPDFSIAPPTRLRALEQACLEWRWRLRRHATRLARVHGDFHPFNVLFTDGAAFRLLDRSRGEWGEPADDVSAMAINYLFFSLQRSGRLAPPFERLWDRFWEIYLTESGDDGLLEVVAPFFVWRALVLASPIWYQVDDPVRAALFDFAEAVIATDRFEPDAVGRTLRGVS